MNYRSVYGLLASVLLIALLAACGGGATPDSSGTAENTNPTPEPVDQLVIDFPPFDPKAYYTFDNPGGWTVYQELNLSDPGQNVTVAVLVFPDDPSSFEEYVLGWTNKEFESQTAENGWVYTITAAGETPSIFIETTDGIRWLFQIHKRSDDADPESFTDTVLQIGLSATYIPREADE
ncbi:MAG: hypothetical protein H6672_16260 [Anaerolineaceae bacterium]|nr:hypothetical protein [Anaerolineaceae bacterium]